MFLTMELLASDTLGAGIRRSGAMQVTDALPIVQQMIAGLAAADEVGIVHRDFKSENVMLVERTPGALRVVVTDFGLARVADGLADGSLTGSVARRPLPGLVSLLDQEQLLPARTLLT